MAEREGNPRPRVIGRYELHAEVARGGMATVHIGRIMSDVGFSRTVAIKRLHAAFAKDPMFSAMFIDEARLAARIQHPNVVSTLDVVDTEGELFVVMDYVQGEALSHLIRGTVAKGGFIPVEIVSSIAVGMLDGLHAAHEAKDERGQPLGIVHRDVSPQNVIVGIDGVARVIDFGVAKATGRLQTTRKGQLKGKLGYMPPEQFEGRPADRRGDVYSAAVVVWEALTCQRLFEGQTEAETFRRILSGPPEPPSTYGLPEAAVLDDVVMRGLSRDREERFATAREMALAIERAVPPASTRNVGEWVTALAAEALAKRAQWVAQIERPSVSGVNVASIADGDDAQWRHLADRASAGAPGAMVNQVVSALGGPLPLPVGADLEDSTAMGPAAKADAFTDEATPADPLPHFDVPTPVNPIEVAALRAPTAAGSGPLPVERESSPTLATRRKAAESPMGTTWTETREGAGFRVEFRPVSIALVGLVIALAVVLSIWIFLQGETFGVVGMIGLGVGMVGAFAIVMRMLEATIFSFTANELTIEHKPGARSTTIPLRHIQKFAIVDEGPAKAHMAFFVQILQVEGAAQRLEVSFSTEAEALWASQRFNQMLADVRSAGVPR